MLTTTASGLIIWEVCEARAQVAEEGKKVWGGGGVAVVAVP